MHTSGKPVILIVDDESTNISILQDILEKDFEIMGTKMPKKAIELARRFKPDLILLDVMMPEMDGWDVCKTLKADPQTQSIGIFFVTAKNDSRDRIKGFELGAQDYLTKPVLAKEVEARVKGFLARKQEEQHLKKQLEQAKKMEAIGTLAGGILHDINNLLTPIMGYVHILMKRFTGKNLEMLHRIYQSTLRLSELSRQILLFSRKSPGRKEPLRLKVQIKEIIKLLQIGFPKSIQISLSLPDNPFIIKADLTQIHQVILNLCINAAHAMDNKGELKISLDEVEIGPTKNEWMTRRCKPGKYVILRVEDSGCGMGEETLKKIFDPFYTTKNSGEGTGLGLATVKAIVEENKGGIRVKSEVGKGTYFDIFFPSYDQPMKKEKHITSEIQGGEETILVIDDEKDIVDSVTMILEEVGYTVIATTDGTEAVDLFSSCDIDLVITDCDMPGLDGFELIKKIQCMDDSVPIIICTGYPCRTQIRGLKQGFHVIYKPFNPVQICEVIRKLLNASRQ